jgi:hypothetical protein
MANQSETYIYSYRRISVQRRFVYGNVEIKRGSTVIGFK